jgi:hypothetical protein
MNLADLTREQLEDIARKLGEEHDELNARRHLVADALRIKRAQPPASANPGDVTITVAALPALTKAGS